MSDDNPKLLAKSTQDTVDLWRNGLLSGRHVQVINFHATPSYRRDEYRRQLEACAKAFPRTRFCGDTQDMTGCQPCCV